MLYLVAKFGQLSQKIPHLTSSVVTKNEAFHHIQQPAAHSTILGITCADLRRDIARSFSNSKIKWASSGTPCEGSKNPLYSKNSLPLITSQRVAGRRKVLTSKRKSQATHPVQRNANNKVKVSNNSTLDSICQIYGKGRDINFEPCLGWSNSHSSRDMTSCLTARVKSKWQKHVTTFIPVDEHIL